MALRNYMRDLVGDTRTTVVNIVNDNSTSSLPYFDDWTVSDYDNVLNDRCECTSPIMTNDPPVTPKRDDHFRSPILPKGNSIRHESTCSRRNTALLDSFRERQRHLRLTLSPRGISSSSSKDEILMWTHTDQPYPPFPDNSLLSNASINDIDDNIVLRQKTAGRHSGGPYP